MRRAERNASGEAIARLEGSCPECGPISMTAGQWRLVQNIGCKRRPGVTKVLPGEESHADWRIGNPLTFNDKVSGAYGSARFGHNEGFHGALVTRFKLLKEKAWYSDSRQVERDLLQVFCSMHTLAMEQRRRAAAAPTVGAGPSPEAPGGPPPPLAVAA